MKTLKFEEMIAQARKDAAVLRTELERAYPGKKFVYVAGGIEKLAGSKARTWREKAKTLLSPEIHVLDPMVHGIGGDPVPLELADIFASDALLMELNIPNRMYCGTIMEDVYAFVAGVPVVIWSSMERVKNDPWIAKHRPVAICDTLEEAVKAVKSILIPMAKKTPKINKSVVISGYASSGKSTLAKKLAEHFDVVYVDGGDALKELAAQEGYVVTGKEWWDMPEGMKFLSQRKTDPDFDYRVDDILKRYANGLVVMTSWTLPWIHKGPVNVWLDTPRHERISRLSGRDGISLQEAERIIETRDRENREHYHVLYEIRFGDDLSPFHVILDGSKSVGEIFEDCVRNIHAHQ